MNKLRELFETKIKILAEKKTKDGDTMQILAPWIVTGRKNKNGRLYPYDLIQREIAKVQAKIKAGALISSADHPAVHTSLADASHIIRKLELDKDGKGWMEATILPTTKGKNVMTIIKAGGQLGISARGAGTVNSSGTVEKDYSLLGIDFCTSPSEPEAVFNKDNVCESLEFEEDTEGTDTLADREEALFDLLHTSYDKAINDGMWFGDFESYKALHEKGLRATLLLPEKDGKPSVQKLTEQQVKDRTYGFYEEAIQGGFKGTFDEWKEQFPKIVEMANKPIKISEKKAPEVKTPEKYKMTWDEVVASGWKGTVAEWRETYPQMELILPAPPQKKIVETLDEEAQRIFEGLKKDNPNNSVTLQTVKRMLEAEQEEKIDKRIRRKAIAIISRECDGSMSQEKLEKMVEQEIKNLKEEQSALKKRELVAYRRLLEE